MGTRPGALDPGVVLYLFQALGLLRQGSRDDALQASRACSASPGISNDMRDLLDERASPAAQLAVDYFVYRAAEGDRRAGRRAAAASTGWCSPPASARTRRRSARRICEASAWLGIELDRDANARGGPRISAPRSRVSAWVMPTNEELMIARHTGGAARAGRPAAGMAMTECAHDHRRGTGMGSRRRITVDGNEAAASVAYRASETIAIYPITPSSPMAEVCDEWASRSKPNLWGARPRDGGDAVGGRRRRRRPRRAAGRRARRRRSRRRRACS